VDNKLSIEGLSTKDKILAVAMEQFFSMEYGKVTLKGIAEQAGVTKGGIYHYFDSKDHLLHEALTFSFASIMEGMEVALTGNETIYEVLEKWFDFEKMMGEYANFFSNENGAEMMLQFMYLILMALRKFPEMGDQFGSLYEDALIMMSGIIKKGQDSGEIRPDLDPEALALQLTTSFEGAALLGSFVKSYDLKTLGKKLFQSFWNQIKVIKQ